MPLSCRRRGRLCRAAVAAGVARAALKYSRGRTEGRISPFRRRLTSSRNLGRGSASRWFWVHSCRIRERIVRDRSCVDASCSTGGGEGRPGGDDGPALPQRRVRPTLDMRAGGPVRPSAGKKDRAEGAGDAPQLPRCHPGVIVDERGRSGEIAWREGGLGNCPALREAIFVHAVQHCVSPPARRARIWRSLLD